MKTNIETLRDGAGLDAVRAYYDQTWLDYRVLWMNPANRAIHFGYWDEHTHSHAESLVNMNRAMAARVQLREGESILDAGCGVGGTAMWLAEEYRAHVVGITPVETQVARARGYAQERGLEQLVRFEREDYRHTNFADASFDVVWAQESVCHAEDKREFLKEAYRVLKPGGRLGVLEYFRFDRPYSASDEALLHSWLSGWAIPDLGTSSEFLEWSRQMGFADVQVEDIESHVLPSHRRLYRFAALLYPLGALLHAVGLRSDVQLSNHRGARDQWRALRRGLWFEGFLTAGKHYSQSDY